MANGTTHLTRVRVDPAGRIVIPVQVRERLGIVSGQELLLSEESNSISTTTLLDNLGKFC